MIRRLFMRVLVFLRLLIAFSLLVVVPNSFSQSYPDRTIKIIVAYQAGQGTDTATRYLAEQVAKELGQSIIIDNRPGAAGNLGTELAAQALPDGYTLTMGTNATHVMNTYLYPGLRFDPNKDFEPIALIGTFPMIIGASPSSGIKNITDLLNIVKNKPNGADIAVPSTTARLVVELLKEKTHSNLFYVPYKGTSSALTDVVGGQLPLIIDTPTGLKTQMASGNITPIAVTSLVQSNLAPGVKTVVEQGISDFEVIAWNALFAPKGTPAPIINTLNTAFNKILNRPETIQKLIDLGFDPAGGSPTKLSDFIKNENKKWGPLIKNSGIKVE